MHGKAYNLRKRNNFCVYYETEISLTHIISLHLKILNSKNETVTFPYTAEVSTKFSITSLILKGGVKSTQNFQVEEGGGRRKGQREW